MGGNLAIQCVEKGIRVVGKARSPKPELATKGVKVVKTYDEIMALADTHTGRMIT